MYISPMHFTFLQLFTQTSEKDVALQQLTMLNNQLKESGQIVQELEAAKIQLEQDSFTIQNTLQNLELQYKQVLHMHVCECVIG